jgi:hypothetical protein
MRVQPAEMTTFRCRTVILERLLLPQKHQTKRELVAKRQRKGDLDGYRRDGCDRWRISRKLADEWSDRLSEF